MENKYIPSYLWIKNFRSISNMGFHFTNEYEYSYDAEKNILTRTKNDKYIKDFYGNNINISAIVGQNGVGKTTIMTAIKECFDLSNEEENEDPKYIIAFSNGMVWSKENDIKYYKFPEGTQSLKLSDNNLKGRYSYFEPKPPVSCIYYSQDFNWSQINSQNSSIINLSSGNLLEYYERASNYYRAYFYNEFNKQLSFIVNADNKKIKKVIKFKLPESVRISYIFYDINKITKSLTQYITDFSTDKNYEKEELRNHIINLVSGEKNISFKFLDKFFYKPDKDYISKYFDSYINLFVKYNTDSKSPFLYEFKTNLSIAFLFTLFERFGGRLNNGISLLYFIKSLFRTNITKGFDKCNSWDRIGILFSCIIEELKDLNKNNTDDEVVKEITTLKNFYQYINYDMISKINCSYEGDFMNSECFKIALNNDNYIHDTTFPFNISFNEFWKAYEPVSRFCDIFNSTWNLSSGEIARLELYSRLYDVTKSTRWQHGEYHVLYRSNNSVLLLIDEADMLLHPEWQRTFIYDIVTVLPKIFPKQYISVIIATHSPIMLSDIPKQNVLFLKNENGIEEAYGCDTFAANIFQLFKEGFFIGDTGIGTFAEKKLKDIVGYIHDKEDESCNNISDEEIVKLISAVGDTFLKNKLNEEYLLFRSKAKTVEEEQAKKINALESEKNELIKRQSVLMEQKADDIRKIKKAINKLKIQKEKLSESKQESTKDNENVFNVVMKLLEDITMQEE